MPFIPILLVSAAFAGAAAWWFTRDDEVAEQPGGYLPAPTGGGFQAPAATSAQAWQVMINPDGSHALVFDLGRNRWLSKDMVGRFIADKLPMTADTMTGIARFASYANPPAHRITMGGQRLGDPAAPPGAPPPDTSYMTLAGPGGRLWNARTPAGPVQLLVFRGTAYL